MRRLLTSRRHVPLDRADDYLLAWAALKRDVEALGARAWIFRGAAHEDQFMEFVEWSDSDASPLLEQGVADALDQLESFAPSHPDEWEETS